MCLCVPFVWRSLHIFCKSFLFFVLSVLWYFPFHAISVINIFKGYQSGRYLLEMWVSVCISNCHWMLIRWLQLLSGHLLLRSWESMSDVLYEVHVSCLYLWPPIHINHIQCSLNPLKGSLNIKHRRMVKLKDLFYCILSCLDMSRVILENIFTAYIQESSLFLFLLCDIHIFLINIVSDLCNYDDCVVICIEDYEDMNYR